jgi:predicted PurR-regulated permease PerM
MLVAILVFAVLALLLLALLLALFTSAAGVLREVLAKLTELASAQQETSYLRQQNTDLHERLLAVHDAGAQARLAQQRIQVTGSSPSILQRAVELPPPRRRSPQEVVLPDSPPGPES